MPITQIVRRAQAGRSTPAILVEPLDQPRSSPSNPGAKIVAKADEITDRSSFLIASKDALDDPAKAAALGDYIAPARARRYGWINGAPRRVVEGGLRRSSTS